MQFEFVLPSWADHEQNIHTSLYGESECVLYLMIVVFFLYLYTETVLEQGFTTNILHFMSHLLCKHN